MKFAKKAAAMAAVFCLSIAAAGAAASAEAVAGQGVSINGTDISGKGYEEVKQIVDDMVAQARSSKITVQVGEDSVEVTASELGLSWVNKDVARKAVGVGNSGNAVKRYKEEKDLLQQGQDISLKFSVSDTGVRSFIENRCMEFEKEAQDATIFSDGAGGVELIPGVTGQVINVDESVKAVQDYIAEQWSGGSGSVALVVQLDEPKGNDVDVESITDNLGSYTTYYSGAAGRNTNVERGAELINGHIILPGETFSVCEHLVPFNAENGYELGGEYQNGQVVQGYGGGICQVSTTLYNALLLAEVEIVERHNHTMSVSYVPTSMDAAIAEGAMDLVFRNNMDTPIFISGYAYGGELTFSVWGKETRPSNREVVYQSETLSTIPASTTSRLYAAPDQAVGYISQVQSAMSGSTAALYKYVYVDGVQQSAEQVNTSSYEATPNGYEVGTSGASQAVLNAIATGDLAAVQAAINGGATTGATASTTTDANGNTITTDGNGNTTITDANGYYVTTDASGNVIASGITTTGASTTTGDAGVIIDPGTTDTTGTTTDGTVTIPENSGGYYIDTEQGEVYVEDPYYQPDEG